MLLLTDRYLAEARFDCSGEQTETVHILMTMHIWRVAPNVTRNTYTRSAHSMLRLQTSVLWTDNYLVMAKQKLLWKHFDENKKKKKTPLQTRSNRSRGWKKCGLLRQVDYGEKCAFGGLKRRSLNTGGLRDRFDCIGVWCSHDSFSFNMHLLQEDIGF